MARRVVDRRELRRENDQAEAQAAEAGPTATPTKAKAKKAASTTTVKRTRKTAAKEVRKKAFWVVYNQNLKSVARFEYAEKKTAEAKAEELSTTAKTPHFVQLVKEEISE
jgi:hypothetical protein